MNKQELIDIVRNVREVQSKTPIRVKVNETWLNSQLDYVVMIKDTKVKGIKNFHGLPLEIDNSINTFEFVYKE